MKPLGAGELLNAWEAGLCETPLQRALILLATALPGMNPETLVRMSVGRRDEYLLQLRESLFGTRLQSTAVCPECSERVEWENHTMDFPAPPPSGREACEEFELETGEYLLRFRLPSSLDVAAIVDHADAGDAESRLLSRCVLAAEQSGARREFSELPDSVIEQLSHRIESLDPLADLRIGLSCPECSHQWVVLFDVASFLWKEVNDWAEQMLRAICQLAAAYGWSERDILGISPVRRQLYLGMLR